jgi:dienelactone hydrolase
VTGRPGRRRILRRARWIAIAGGAVLALLAAGIAGNSLGRYYGWTVPRQPPEELAAALRQYYRVMVPPGDGPFPTGLLFSGCDGPKDNMVRWGEVLNGAGWAAVIVDSHAPRNLQDFEVWRLICTGQLLFGSERAGDVLVAINDARRAAFADPERIVLLGASHGGWAIMELLALEQAWRLPPNLTTLPEAISVDDPLAGIVGQILLYPYCGLGNRARDDGWRHPAPTLFILSTEDTIAPADDCLDVAAILEERGLPVETASLPGVTHGFDQRERAALSTLEYDAAATAEAEALVVDFLARVQSRPSMRASPERHRP